jgi:predicted dehydrogenase
LLYLSVGEGIVRDEQVDGSRDRSLASKAFGGRLEVYGEAGTMTYDFDTDTLQAGRDGDRDLHSMDIIPELEGGWHVEDDFIAGVKSKGRVRPHPDFEDGVRYMRVVQAVADSRARNEWVEIKRLLSPQGATVSKPPSLKSPLHCRSRPGALFSVCPIA